MRGLTSLLAGKLAFADVHDQQFRIERFRKFSRGTHCFCSSVQCCLPCFVIVNAMLPAPTMNGSDSFEPRRPKSKIYSEHPGIPGSHHRYQPADLPKPSVTS
jgi:hypothetical protein